MSSGACVQGAPDAEPRDLNGGVVPSFEIQLAISFRGASPDTLARRIKFGGRKGRSAIRRLRKVGKTSTYAFSQEVGRTPPRGTRERQRWARAWGRCRYTVASSTGEVKHFLPPVSATQREAYFGKVMAWGIKTVSEVPPDAAAFLESMIDRSEAETLPAPPEERS